MTSAYSLFGASRQRSSRRFEMPLSAEQTTNGRVGCAGVPSASVALRISATVCQRSRVETLVPPNFKTTKFCAQGIQRLGLRVEVGGKRQRGARRRFACDGRNILRIEAFGIERPGAAKAVICAALIGLVAPARGASKREFAMRKRPAAQHFFGTGIRPRRILRRRALIIARVKPILDPFKDISGHLVHAP